MSARTLQPFNGRISSRNISVGMEQSISVKAPRDRRVPNTSAHAGTRRTRTRCESGVSFWWLRCVVARAEGRVEDAGDAAFCASCWTDLASSTTSSTREILRCQGMTIRKTSVQLRLSRQIRDLVCFWSGGRTYSPTLGDVPCVARFALCQSLAQQELHRQNPVWRRKSSDRAFPGVWIVHGEVN